MKQNLLKLLASVTLFTLLATPTATPAPMVEKGLVILVQFPDVKHSMKRQVVQRRFNWQLDNYVREMSYNKVSLNVDVTERWHTLPDSVSRYRISPRNLEVDRSRVRKLIDDALAAVEAEVDFSKYSFTALFMGAGIDDYGMVGLCGYPGMLGWSADGALRTRRGQPVKGGVAIFCYQAHLGTLFHDIAHILGGVQGGRRMVPCLYDHDLQAKPGPPRETAIEAMVNLGFWDPMSCHFYQRSQPPPGLCSWTRLRLNWIDPAKVKVIKPNQTAEVTLGPLESGTSETLVVKIPLSETTCYLLENRQPIGCDKVLPRHGVLILQADDRTAECRQGRAPVKLVNADPSVAHLEGAAFDVGKQASYQDASHNLRIQLTQKLGDSYKIRISPLSSR